MILYTGEFVHVKFMKDQYKYVNKFEIVTLWKKEKDFKMYICDICNIKSYKHKKKSY